MFAAALHSRMSDKRLFTFLFSKLPFFSCVRTRPESQDVRENEIAADCIFVETFHSDGNVIVLEIIY